MLTKSSDTTGFNPAGREADGFVPGDSAKESGSLTTNRGI